MNFFILLSNIILITVFLLQKSIFPPQIPLFYSRQLGEDQLGEWWMIFIIPILMNVFFIVNQFIYKKFFRNNEFVLKVLYVTNSFILTSFTLIFVKIVLLTTL